ncbi:hypothetical protein Celaphus_00013507, partial [Cervus elaphus hippelaphus]
RHVTARPSTKLLRACSFRALALKSRPITAGQLDEERGCVHASKSDRQLQNPIALFKGQIVPELANGEQSGRRTRRCQGWVHC